MANINTNDQTEKRISLVYNSDITGFQPMDFSKIDGIESLLTSGISVTASILDGDSNLRSYIEDGINSSRAGQVAQNLGDGPCGYGVQIALETNDGNSYAVSAGNPLPISGTVTTIQQKKSNISNFTPSGTNGTVLQANVNREELFVQNLSVNPLFVKYGEDASDSSFNFVLTSGSAELAGDGGTLSDLNYTGIVSVNGVSSNYICWERS
jgi:hypothetical protein